MVRRLFIGEGIPDDSCFVPRSSHDLQPLRQTFAEIAARYGDRRPLQGTGDVRQRATECRRAAARLWLGGDLRVAVAVDGGELSPSGKDHRVDPPDVHGGRKTLPPQLFARERL